MNLITAWKRRRHTARAWQYKQEAAHRMLPEVRAAAQEDPPGARLAAAAIAARAAGVDCVPIVRAALTAASLATPDPGDTRLGEQVLAITRRALHRPPADATPLETA